MSFIKRTTQCKCCKREIKYFWLYDDCKMDYMPSREEYIFANDYYDRHYIVSVKCPKCKTMLIEYYDDDGNLEE